MSAGKGVLIAQIGVGSIASHEEKGDKEKQKELLRPHVQLDFRFSLPSNPEHLVVQDLGTWTGIPVVTVGWDCVTGCDKASRN